MTDVASLGIVVKTQGAKEAARDLDRLDKQAASAEKRALSLGKAWGIALGGVAAAVIVGGVKAIISNTIEAEKVQARLENRVRALGATSAASVKQVDRLATALQSVSTFDDESLKSAATSLLAFNNIKPQNFERAMRAATDLAADSGDDLVATAERVGKALNNPATAARALREVGIELSAAQKNVIKDLVAAGREGEAQGLVLAELEKRYAGAAQAARNTLGGSLAALKVAFGNLLEGSGGVNDTTKGVNDFTDALNSPDVKRGADAIVSGVFRIAGALAGLIGQLANATLALSEFFAANDKKGLTSLQNKRTDLETDLFVEQRAQRRSWLGPAAEENAPRVKALKAEIAEIDRLIGARTREQRQAAANEANAKSKVTVVQRGKGVFANVLGKGETAPLPTGERPAKAGGRSGGGGGGSDLRRLQLDAKEAAAELARLAEQEARSTDSFLDMKAALEGPLSVELREHQKNVAELNQLAKESPTALAGLNEALALEAQRHGAATEEIKRQLDPLTQLLDSMRFEVDMIGESNAVRAVMLDLRRQNIDIMSTEAQGALAVARAYVEEERAKQAAIDLMDDFRSGAVSTLTDIVTGAKSAKEALTDFFDNIAAQITRAIAQQWFDKLLGPQGSNSGGSAGGGIMSLLGSLLGGARAIGGPVSAGRMYEVGERGPELLTAGGRTFMIPPASGQVTPMAQSSGRSSGGTVNQTFVVQGTLDRRSRAHLARDTGREAERAISRYS